jgi:hypothetical protein
MITMARVFLTVAQIAERLDVPRHRVVYALQVNAVPHAVEIGDLKGYDESALEVIRERIRAERRGVSFSSR